MTRSRALPIALSVFGIMLLVSSATLLGTYYFGHGRAGRALSSAPLSAGLSPKPTPALSSPTAAPVEAATPAKVVEPGIPVRVVVQGRVQARVSANKLNVDGSLYVPPNPRAVSWANQDVGPGSTYGTIILVGHVNFRGVAGVFSDLADYQVGQVITLVLADGRRMQYAVAAPPIEVDKDELGPRRQELFDQTHSYGAAGGPKTSRLLLLSCGGLFDNRTGHYQSNIFVFALPV